MAKCFIIEPRRVLQADLPDELEILQTIVGGDIEGIRLNGEGDPHAYCGKDAIAQRQPPNALASLFVRKHATVPAEMVIFGTIVVLGGDHEGGEADLPEWAEVSIRELVPAARKVVEVARSAWVPSTEDN
jgi:hypothetical protein